jgi:hypothetical protein
MLWKAFTTTVDKLKDWDVQAKSMKMSVFKTVRTV